MSATVVDSVLRWLDTITNDERLPEDWEVYAWQIRGPGSRQVYEDSNGEKWSYAGSGASQQLIERVTLIASMTDNWRFTIRVANANDFPPGETRQQTFSHVASSQHVILKQHAEMWLQQKQVYEGVIAFQAAQLKAAQDTIESLQKVVRDLGGDVRIASVKPLEISNQIGELMGHAINSVSVANALTIEAGRTYANSMAAQDPVNLAKAQAIQTANNPFWKLVNDIVMPLVNQIGMPAIAAMIGIPAPMVEEYVKAFRAMPEIKQITEGEKA